MLGIVPASFVDYPGKICATVFFPGCNLRCPFCHNPSLVFGHAPCDATLSDVLALLDKRKPMLDAVCLSGGEPLLHVPVLLELLPLIKEKGFLVKLDTNGCFPEALTSLLDSGWLDYVAMDIKSSPAQYARAGGIASIEMDNINASIHAIMHSPVDYEFRTTVVPEFFTDADAEAIGKWIKGAKRYVLQPFSRRSPMVDPEFQSKPAYPPDQLVKFKKIIEEDLEHVEIRGA